MAVIKIVERTRAGTPVRTFKVDLPLNADGKPQPNEAYVAAAKKRRGADFKYPNDQQAYGWRVRELGDPATLSKS